MTQATITRANAAHFDRKSQNSIDALADQAEKRGCTCRAYVDWFTYRRWQAQGMQVQRDEKGFKLATYHTEEEQHDDGSVTTKRRRYTAALFCRCQVQPKANGR